MDLTPEEIERLSEALMPSMHKAMRKAVRPLRAEVRCARQEIKSLRLRANLWGAVTGALTALGINLLPK